MLNLLKLTTAKQFMFENVLMYENIHILMKHLSYLGLRIIIYATYSIDTGRKIHGWGSKQKEHAQTVVDELGKRYKNILMSHFYSLYFSGFELYYKKKQRKWIHGGYFGFCFGQRPFSNKFCRNHNSCHLLCCYVTAGYSGSRGLPSGSGNIECL